MVYKKCPYCGASLDPNERCDCSANESENETAENVEKESPKRSSSAMAAFYTQQIRRRLTSKKEDMK